MSNNNDLYKIIVDTTNEGVWVIDENSQTTFTNAKMNHILGYDEGEMTGKGLFDFMDEEGVKIAKENLAKREDGISEMHEFKFMDKNGSTVWTQMNASPMFEKEKYIGALAMVTDITLKKAEEKKQLEEHRKYISLFEDCPVPIWDEDFSEVKIRIDELKESGVVDFKEHFENNLQDVIHCAQGMKVNDVNKAVVILNEASSKEQIINHFADLATRETLKSTISQLVAVAENKTSFQHEVKLRTFGGNYRHVLMKWTVVKGYEHNYKKVYLSTTDFTDRIIEENLFLTNTNKEKEILLKEIHHRVKNNLQIIMSLLNLQSSSINDLETKNLFQVSIGRIQSMSLVHKLLYVSKDFSKIEYGEYLRMLISTLIQSMKGIESSIMVDLKMKDIYLNVNTSIPLGLIITELVTNSLKHGIKNDDGSVYIEINHQENNTYTLNIGDDGNGVDNSFDYNNTDTLGLQLVTSLVEQLQGEISRVTSKKGMHFKISFQEIEDNSMR